jgi:HEAT repeat protein
MLAIARKGGKAADDAILPAMLADSVTIWPDLIRLAKNPSVNTDVRKSAIFWVGQAAAKAATAGLVEVVGDAAVNQDVREAAVFALSQRPHDEGVPALITTARTANDAKIRKSAIFWLGQTDDPRALAYFEEVLAKGASRN